MAEKRILDYFSPTPRTLLRGNAMKLAERMCRTAAFGKEACQMNEIITKLNEIEEKASAIISDARERKNAMMVQLQQDEKEIDITYDRLLEENSKHLAEKLQAETEERIAGDRERAKKATWELNVLFQTKKDQLAEEIFARIIQ